MQSKEDKYLIDIVNAEYERIKNSLIEPIMIKSFSKILEVDEQSYEIQALVNGLCNEELTIKDELLNIINFVDTYTLIELLKSDRYTIRYKYNVIKYSLYALKDLDTLNEQTKHKELKTVKKSFTTNVNNMLENGYIFAIKKPKGIDEIEKTITKNIKDEFCNQEELKEFITYLLDKNRFNAKGELTTKLHKPTSKMNIDELENLKTQIQQLPTIYLKNILK